MADLDQEKLAATPAPTTGDGAVSKALSGHNGDGADIAPDA